MNICINNWTVLFYYIGTPQAMRFEDGRFLDLHCKINKNLKNEEHVWFLL